MAESNVTKYITLESLQYFYQTLRGDKFKASHSSYGGVKIKDPKDTSVTFGAWERELKLTKNGHAYITLFTPSSEGEIQSANYGSSIIPIYILNGQPISTGDNLNVSAIKLSEYKGNANGYHEFADYNVGSGSKPIYFDGGAPVVSTSTIGQNTTDNVKPIWMSGGELKTFDVNVGLNENSTMIPVYFKNGAITPASVDIGQDSNTGVKPIYMHQGTLKAVAQTLGSDDTTKGVKPVWMDKGALKAVTVSLGTDIASGVKPIYMDKGALKAATASLGTDAESEVKPIYMDNGVLKAVTAFIGTNIEGSVQPIYMDRGALKAATKNLGSGASTDTSAQAIYMSGGALKPISKTIGSATKPIYMKDGVFTACNDIVYTSAIEDTTLKMPNAVGGIKKDTTVEALNGKTFSYLFDELLFPTVAPTYTAPSASIKWKSGFVTTKEVGTSISLTVGADSSNIIQTGFNAGQITLDGKKQANRSGALDEENSFVYVNGNENNKTLPTIVALGNTTFKYKASYAEGPQPKNNKNGNVDEDGNALTPLPAGSCASGNITLNGTWPWYATTNNAGVLTKQSLIAWNSTAGTMTKTGVDLTPHNNEAGTAQIIKVPRALTSLKMYSTVSKQYDSVDITSAKTEWKKTTETVTAADGTTKTTYYIYTYSGDNRSSIKIEISF